MSYVVEIIRPIGKEEVLALAQSDEELTVLTSGDDSNISVAMGLY